MGLAWMITRLHGTRICASWRRSARLLHVRRFGQDPASRRGGLVFFIMVWTSTPWPCFYSKANGSRRNGPMRQESAATFTISVWGNTGSARFCVGNAHHASASPQRTQSSHFRAAGCLPCYLFFLLALQESAATMAHPGRRYVGWLLAALKLNCWLTWFARSSISTWVSAVKRIACFSDIISDCRLWPSSSCRLNRDVSAADHGRNITGNGNSFF